MASRTTLKPATLDHAASVIRCLGHPLRLQLLDAMENEETTVTELQAVTGASQAMVSQQLATLRGHGVVAARRDGAHVRYSIVEPKVHQILACIRGCEL
jgi:DNA-binding transcriptional ArsR family regulator